MKRPTQIRAMVFVLSHRLLPDVGICIDYCIAHGYHMDGIVKDDWTKAVDYLYSDKCDVLVVAGDETLDPDRIPRIEAVAHQHTQPARPDIPIGRRRPGDRVRGVRTSRITRRDAGA